MRVPFGFVLTFFLGGLVWCGLTLSHLTRAEKIEHRFWSHLYKRFRLRIVDPIEGLMVSRSWDHVLLFLALGSLSFVAVLCIPWLGIPAALGTTVALMPWIARERLGPSGGDTWRADIAGSLQGWILPVWLSLSYCIIIPNLYRGVEFIEWANP